MNREDIIRMAREAGFLPQANPVTPQLLERFAALVASAEREKFCAVLRQLHDSYSLASDSNDIRARGYANDTSAERVDINGERKHDAQHS
jgi:hypothetical protein